MNFEDGYNDLSLEEDLKQVVDILNNFPEFYEYLMGKDFPYFELPYIFFWQVIEYIKVCDENKNYEEIKEILQYLWVLLKKKDSHLRNLILEWCLENFNMYPELFQKVFKIMPFNLKKIFRKFYPNYLN